MEIAACIKQVPRPGSVRAAGDHLAWKDEHDAHLNPYALNVVEAALRIVEKTGGRVTVLAAGDASVEPMLREAVSIGAERAVRVEAPPLLRQDALVLARCLAAAVQALGDLDLVITGTQSSVGGPGLVPAMMAELLGWPLVSSVAGIEDSGDIATMHRRSDEGLQIVKVEIPAVISVLREIADARHPLSMRRAVAQDMPIQVIPAPPDAVPAPNLRFIDAPPPAQALFLADPPDAAARELLVRLRQDGLLTLPR